MNKVIKLTKGLDIDILGAAAKETLCVARPAVFAIVPDHFGGIVPKIVVKEGEQVKAGSPLFHDKQFAQMNFVSPVSGTVLAINRGERRKVMSITIQADEQITYLPFERPQMEAQAVKDLLLQAGLWGYIKQRPYDVIANPNKAPKAIFISSFDSAPLAPDYEYVLKGRAAELQAAVNALALLSEGKVYVGLKAGSKAADFRSLKNVEFVEFDGPHPAGNVGVQINHVCPVNKGEVVWTVNIQDLAIIGRLLVKGIVDMHRVIALTGPMVTEPKYYSALPGCPIRSIVNCNVHKELPLRYISGNVLSGHQVDLEEMIEPYCNQISVIDEGCETHELLGWAMPRFAMFSAGRTYLSKWLTSRCYRSLFGHKEFHYDARMLGGRRAIIVSGEYDKVLPMDIYPEYLIKAMIAGNLDKMEQLGAYEVAPEDFALCEYVCTSKMPLQAIVRKALDTMKSELE